MAERILYLFYIISWKKSHKRKAFKGCSPACFNEWHDCELQEMVTHPDWYAHAPFVGALVESIREKRARNG